MRRTAAKFLLAACLAQAAAPARALEVSAGLDRSAIAVDETVTLTVTVSGDSASIPDPQVPDLPAFNVYSSGRSQEFSIINGKVSNSVTFSYMLSPRYIGRHKIPPIGVFTGREKFFTRELEIEVTTASQGQQAAPARPQAQRPARGRARRPEAAQEPIYIQAELDRRRAYPNEQINLSVKFFTSVPLLANPQYVPPQLRNLMAEDLPPVRSGETVIDGTRYYFNEIKTALFGLGAGKASVDGARILALVQRSPGAIDPFDPGFFQKFFSMNMGQGDPVELATKPLAIEIMDFPEGAPQGFAGAVGNYIVSASVDRRELKAGEALTLKVTVSGKGNLKSVTEPKLPEMPSFKVYDTVSSLDVTKNSDSIGGRKTFTTLMVPKNEGYVNIPPVRFSFFNPETKSYQTLETQAIEIRVLKGDGGSAAINFGGASGKPGVSRLETDIAYIKEKARRPALDHAARRFISLWWLHLLPLALLAWALLSARAESFRLANPLLFRSRGARRSALRRLGEARDRIKAGEFKPAAALIHDIFLDYLSDKSGAPIGSLTMKKAAEALKARFPGASDPSLGRVKVLWEQLEFYRYAPAELDPVKAGELADAFESLLENLEEEFRK